jgi:hypothetical protein
MRRPLIRRKDFHNFHCTREQAQGRVMGNLAKRSFFNYMFFLEEEENECVRGELVVICEEVLFMEANVCKQKSMGGSCV